MGAPLDLTGQRYGRLLVAALSGSRGGYRLWLCNCDCGGTTIQSSNKLRVGDTRSCGCLNTEARSARIAERNRRHGHNLRSGPSPTYVTWGSMLQRCEYPTHKAYKDYGARGIQVCDRWHNFANFLADMGERPAGTSIDRIDTSGHYAPGNCRWATSREQSMNKRTTRRIMFQGEARTVYEIAAITGRTVAALRHEIRRGVLA